MIDKDNLKKEEWGPGPWQDEPDRVEFEHAGFPCLLLRNTDVTGVWCGYVAVPRKHPYYKKHYNNLPVDVHGGLTYAASCSGDICHKPKPGDSDDVWWLGFDCAHFMDVCPRMNALYKTLPGMSGVSPFAKGTYKTQDWVTREVKELAEQLHAVKRTGFYRHEKTFGLRLGGRTLFQATLR